MTIKEACDLLKEELLDNEYEYGFGKITIKNNNLSGG